MTCLYTSAAYAENEARVVISSSPPTRRPPDYLNGLGAQRKNKDSNYQAHRPLGVRVSRKELGSRKTRFPSVHFVFNFVSRTLPSSAYRHTRAGRHAVLGNARNMTFLLFPCKYLWHFLTATASFNMIGTAGRRLFPACSL